MTWGLKVNIVTRFFSFSKAYPSSLGILAPCPNRKWSVRFHTIAFGTYRSEIGPRVRRADAFRGTI